MVSLAFHLFVIGTVIFVSVLLMKSSQSRNSLFLQRKMWVPYRENKDSVHM